MHHFSTGNSKPDTSKMSVVSDPDMGYTRRLSFDQVSQHLNATQQMDVEEVIKAVRQPSVDGFRR